MLEMYSKSGEAARAHYAARDQMEAATMSPEPTPADAPPDHYSLMANNTSSEKLANMLVKHNERKEPLDQEALAAVKAELRSRDITTIADLYKLSEEQDLKHKPTQEKAIEVGARGGKFYISATGQKVYVKPNPGVELLGTVQPTPFVSGLPQSVSMNQPNTGAGIQHSMMFGNRPK